MSMGRTSDIGPTDKSAQGRIPEPGSAGLAQAPGVGVQAPGALAGDEEEFLRLQPGRAVEGRVTGRLRA
jgi:hypothetical protein